MKEYALYKLASRKANNEQQQTARKHISSLIKKAAGPSAGNPDTAKYAPAGGMTTGQLGSSIGQWGKKLMQNSGNVLSAAKYAPAGGMFQQSGNRSRTTTGQ